MYLDGLRAWIGEVERKLGVRSRVFLVLAAIAVGGAGAGIYLAVEARNDSVSESDVRALQEKLEARIVAVGAAAAGAGGQSVATLEAEVKALKAQVYALQAGQATKPPAEGGTTAKPPEGGPATKGRQPSPGPGGK